MGNEQKKSYVKPMIVFENYETGELTGSPKMIAQIRAEAEEYKEEAGIVSCPFDGVACFSRG